jgi:Uma2 family endonuclease
MIKLYTAEEYSELHTGQYDELVRGVIQLREFPAKAHCYTTAQIVYFVARYLEDHPIGVVLTETGYVTQRDPDSVRGPDASFTTNERSKAWPRRGYPDFTPDLAVEVRSPSNRDSEIEKKIGEYFGRGTRLVWLADPKKRTVTVYPKDALAYVVSGSESLDGGDVLPGFRVAVNKLFGWPPSETPGE